MNQPNINITRKTQETNITVSLTINGSGSYSIKSPVPFFNHLIESLAKFGSLDLVLQAEGDIAVDPHHLIEDCGIVLGESFDRALADRRGIYRAGFFIIPMDDALALAAVDLSGRPYLQYEVQYPQAYCGTMDTALIEEFLRAFANASRANIVVRVPFGRNSHHQAEAAFKALGRALRDACTQDTNQPYNIPSTKGVL